MVIAWAMIILHVAHQLQADWPAVGAVAASGLPHCFAEPELLEGMSAGRL
jgi:hypothetical protein